MKDGLPAGPADGEDSVANDPDQMTRAGNYVLGLMDRKERERAEHDLEIDPGFRDAVFRVAERMHMFDAGAAAAAAGKDDWSAVAARIAEMPQMRRTAAGDLTEAEAEAGRAGVIAPSPVARRKERPHRQRAFAAGAAIGMALFAAGAAGYLLAPRGKAAAPALIAVLETADGNPGAVLEVGADRSLRLVAAAGLPVAEGRSLALWTADAEGGAPVRIAPVAAAGSQVLASEGLPEAEAGQVYRLVLEPAAGETAPGAVLAEGTARPVLSP